MPGFDLTLSAPKSVSVLWALGEPNRRPQVVDCHERAVDAALGYLGEHELLGFGEATPAPKSSRANGFVGAVFRHRTSRAGDPALHSHVLVANLAEGPDGRWTALDARHLYREARTAGFVYQAVLRHELAVDLGRPVRRRRPRPRRDRRHPRRTCAASSRNAAAPSVTRWHAVGCTRAPGAQVVTLDTREAKGLEPKPTPTSASTGR